jgi:tRNA threonylcarbamoyladenosine biosynthesis protein TsaB
MNLLVIDTSTEACSVALEIDGTVFSRFEVCPQQHSQRLLPMVDEVLKEANVKLSQLDYLGFGRGPGSFTGVRIATGMIQGLALGSALPVVGISTLAAMAQQAIIDKGAAEISCAIDARIGEVYFARYVANNNVAKLIAEEQVLAPRLAADLLSANKSIGVGTGWKAYSELNSADRVEVTEDILYPNALYMLPLFKHAISDGEAKDIEQIQPVYLRDKVTWKKLPGRG